jgi:TPR repeat protein
MWHLPPREVIEAGLREAAEFIRGRAAMGISEYQVAYAHCLQNGKGTPVDLTESARYFQLAADQGNSSG